MPLPLALPRVEDEERPHVRDPRLTRFAKSWSRALRQRVAGLPDMPGGSYCLVLSHEDGWSLDVCCQDGNPVPEALREAALETCPVDEAPPLPARLEVLVFLWDRTDWVVAGDYDD